MTTDTTEIPITRAGIAAAYRAAIEEHRAETTAFQQLRLQVEQQKRDLEVRHAELSLTVMGRNAAERDANLTLAVEGDATYLSIRQLYDDSRAERALHERERDYQLHLCRLYQAMLAAGGE